MKITNKINVDICNTYGANVLLLSQLGKAALNNNVAEAKDLSGSYGMLADVDVAVTVRQKTGKEIQDGSNFEIYIDKHRYGRDKIFIPAIFDKGTQQIREV